MRHHSNRCVPALVVLLAAGCADTPSERTPEVGGDPTLDAPRLRIEPADLDVTVVNGVAVVQGYRAVMVGDGGEQDVTSETSFTVADPGIGTWQGPTLTIAGTRAGPTAVTASIAGAEARAQLTVRVRLDRIEDTAPANAPLLFSEAASVAGCGPQIVYPEDRVTVPANLGPFEVQWSTSSHDVYEIAVKNDYVDLRQYTIGRDTAWTAVSVADMQLVASTGTPAALQVTGMATWAPSAKCVSELRSFETTREETFGGVYFWSTRVGAETPWEGVMRFDVMQPAIAPERFEPDSGACVGCHAVSRDGTRVALTLDGAGGRGAVYDLVDQREMMPDAGAPSWNASTFTPDGTKLLTVQAGVMKLLDAEGGSVLATVANTPGKISGTPEFSPDGRLVASIEVDGDTDWMFGDASVVVRSFDDDTNTFGAPVMVLPFDAGADLQSYYPSWSPDNRWLAVTRSRFGSSYANTDATAWVVKADGTTPPVQVTPAAGMTESVVRWLPSSNSIGTNEQVFFLSFGSMRAFGTRLSAGQRSQVWVAPFFPARAEQGVVGPAIRAPFQDIRNDNHSAQWANEIVR